MRAHFPSLDLTIESNYSSNYPRSLTLDRPSPDGPKDVAESKYVNDEAVENLEESVSEVKSKLSRLESRLTAMEHRLSTMKSGSQEEVINVRMASFHHVYDPAHRTW